MLKVTLLTALSLFAYAGNSVLCRLALTDDVIDAASFTSIQLFSGIIFLLCLVSIKTKKIINIKNGNWLSLLFLFLVSNMLNNLQVNKYNSASLTGSYVEE
jgi:drug/metabolite transporter (DMT)-like permease